MKTTGPIQLEIQQAYGRYTTADSIRNSKVACVLVALLMPLGSLMDFFVYRGLFGYFLLLRLASSLSAMLVFAALCKPHLTPSQRRIFCAGWYLVPAFFICCMIEATEGLSSTYYAGLNLVILAVSSVIQATLAESITAVGIILLMYVCACAWSLQRPELRMVANNGFFLFCTAAIVITGNYFYNRLRFREFSLRHELDESRRQLEVNNQKLKELDEIKNRFFANISHELRTPLTLLLSPLESMIHGLGQQFDAPTRELLGIMHSNGMRLLKLINDLLDLVRLESGRMEVRREPLEMSAYVRGLTGAAAQMATAKGVKLETIVQSELGPLMLDRDKLEKTILNLLFNALKFTPGGGSVTLRVISKDGQLLITVEDTGVGISEKNLPFVFDRFWQADNSSKRKYQGVGIGLSLVKELTEVQGGSVSVKSQEGVGTTFTVCLPMIRAEGLAPSAAPEATPATPALSTAQAPAKTAPAATGVQSEEWLANLYRRAELFPAINLSQEPVQPAPARQKGSQPRLLVADDEPDMLRFLKSQLTGRYQVIEAVNGLQAIQKATELLPDLILLDMNMPEKDGLQVCRELRQQAATQGIPVIILTARADEETKLSALSAGANDFLTKPFSTSELHVRVKNLVEAHHDKEKLARQKQTLETTIEELKETETMLVQTEKMASLGRMSAGILHEINNPLNYASTGLFTLRNKAKLLAPDQQTEYSEILGEIEDGIKRVKNIVSDLNSFTHPDLERKDAVIAAEIITSALKFLSNEWKDKVQIHQSLPPELVIRGNRNKLLQVFVNLLQNSLDAVRRKKFTDEKPAIWITGGEPDGKVVITVRDNGEGIAAGSISKVFDPFFTTKDVGEGIGLGLTICYRIVKEYAGRITVRSEQGKFCEFTLEFPAQAGDSNGARTAPQNVYEQHA
jgi:signal transduction histidine kinase